VIAVILAAGLGIRFRPFTHTIPKGLIEIGGETLLERSLQNLSLHGIQRAVIVIGHLGHMIREKLSEHCRGVEITYVDNQEYATTGSMYSFSTAREMIRDDVLVLDGDLLYDRIAIGKIVEAKFENCTIVTNFSGSGDEMYVCTDGNGRLTWLGKKIPDHQTPQGESIGITKLSRRFLDRLFNEADQDYRQDLSTYFFDDVVFHTNVRHDDCPVHAVYLDDLKWIDIDRESDYIRAATVLYPQLTQP
jgi:choline kinase